MFGYLFGIIALIVFLISSAIKVLREYERATIFRLGRFTAVKGPGLIFLIPFIDRMLSPKTTCRLKLTL